MHNGTKRPVDDELTRAGLLGVLRRLDVKRFREIVGIGEEVPEWTVIEAIHRTRVKHPGVNRKLKQDSKRWLDEHAV